MLPTTRTPQIILDNKAKVEQLRAEIWNYLQSQQEVPEGLKATFMEASQEQIRLEDGARSYSTGEYAILTCDMVLPGNARRQKASFPKNTVFMVLRDCLGHVCELQGTQGFSLKRDNAPGPLRKFFKEVLEVLDPYEDSRGFSFRDRHQVLQHHLSKTFEHHNAQIATLLLALAQTSKISWETIDQIIRTGGDWETQEELHCLLLTSLGE